MFIYSLRASTLKFFAVICVSLAALITLIAFIPVYGSDGYVSAGAEQQIRYDKIKTNEDRIAFLGQFGWTVNAQPKDEREVTVPEEFDKIFMGYNEIQKRQGLDLSKYKKKTATLYTYEVTNYEGAEGTVYANLLIYRNRVIGGDICSAEAKGFIHGFEKP
ncbi:MAG: DUF4830 domain-containing protein [Clostridia bacterium]|nr:DUF4830 domain-containing protein [Clostridia bacterium]